MADGGANQPNPADEQAQRRAAAMIVRAEQMERLNAVMNYIDTPNYLQYSVFQLQARLDRFRSVFVSLEDANRTALQNTAEADARLVLTNEFFAFEERYLDACAKMEERIFGLHQQAGHPVAVAAQVGPNGGAGAVGGAPNGAGGANANANRPMFQLHVPTQHQSIRNTWGKFDGTLLNWLGFKDRFNMAIHSIADIPGRYKFAYLKDSLEGEAARALGGVLLDDAGYQDAWDRLCNRFEQKYPLARVYMN